MIGCSSTFHDLDRTSVRSYFHARKKKVKRNPM